MKIIDRIRLSKLVMMVTLTVFCFLAIISFRRLHNLIEYSRAVEETNLIRLKTTQCFAYLRDAETGARGYLLTKEPVFLEPLRLTNEKLIPALTGLMTLAEKNAESVIFLQAFRSACLRKSEYLNRFVYNYRNTPLDQISRESIMEDKLLMDQARKKYDAVTANLEKKLAKRQKTKNDYAEVTPLFLIILSLSSILLIFITYVIIIRELKSRIYVQKALEFNLKALERSNTELKQFTYIASHDLQEPLRKIQTFGNRIIEKYAEIIDKEPLQMIEKMQESAARMQVLINDLLVYSSIVDKDQKPTEKVDLDNSMMIILDVLSEDIREKNAIIQHDKLPVVTGHHTQFEQLFQNLISNALKFTAKNSPPVIRILYDKVAGQEIEGNPQGEVMFHRLVFKDNGIGFDEAYKDKLFVIFQRLHNRAEFRGTGIGLAICKKIVTNHGGYIQARSEPGKGSEFTVYLPVIPEAA